MSSTSNIPFNDPTIIAIDNAIHNADKKVCQKADLYNFDPWAQGDPLTPSSHDLCQGFFDREIGGIAHQIPGNLDESDLVSYASTRGWLYGYSCAQEEAITDITRLNDDLNKANNDLNKANNDLNKKTKEAETLRGRLKSKKKELKELSSEKEGKNFPKPSRFKPFYVCLAILAAVAIVIIADWPI